MEVARDGFHFILTTLGIAAWESGHRVTLNAQAKRLLFSRSLGRYVPGLLPLSMSDSIFAGARGDGISPMDPEAWKENSRAILCSWRVLA